ncbi:hypothetical protein [Streptomyces cyanogenus]|nr:hypothetical protein [Streptomyces cyanogenus]
MQSVGDENTQVINPGLSDDSVCFPGFVPGHPMHVHAIARNTELGDVAGQHVVAEPDDPCRVPPDFPVLGGVQIELRHQAGFDEKDVQRGP